MNAAQLPEEVARHILPAITDDDHGLTLGLDPRQAEQLGQLLLPGLAATAPPLLNLSGVKAITVQDDRISSPTAEFLDRGLIVMTTPARRHILDLADSVRLLGREVLEVDSFGGRSKMTAWEVRAHHLSGFEALYEEDGVRVLGLEDYTGDA